ncbi:alcohol dehydrogenase catalytic domain-containing protein [Candidatus Palauibacter sp.]|uniref:alcohol dehydrogenase catalytic domain-containing protein n=1 Tax=Candidatus Palauibacter sp. TaxID=3101350 RepID=UPI003AF2C98E
MRAIWYETTGPAREVLRFGELEAPAPGPGEVRVRMAVSGANPSDTKRRAGWIGLSMRHSRIVPHSDGAGTIDAVGEGVDPARVGERVWLWNARGAERPSERRRISSPFPSTGPWRCPSTRPSPREPGSAYRAARRTTPKRRGFSGVWR